MKHTRLAALVDARPHREPVARPTRNNRRNPMLRSPTTHPTGAPQLRTPVEAHAYSMPVVHEMLPAIRLDASTPSW
jgi:hypothetical protein